MRLGSFVVLGFLAFCAASTSQTPQRADTLEATLVTLEKQSWEAWQRQDGPFFDRFLSDDHVEVTARGVLDKKAIVNFVGSKSCVVSRYTVNGFRVTRISPGTALLTYYAEQDTRCNGVPVPSPVWTSSLYVERGGRWVNVLYQQTVAAPSRQ